MSLAQHTSDPLAAVSADALRLVLFGMPQAGKSSLLGALAQAAESQPERLHGRLLDLSHGLSELRHRLYEGHAEQTAEEVVPYPVRVESAAGAAAERLDAVLVDCDGRVANEYLAGGRMLEEGHGQGALGWLVLEAETLILVVDAAADAAELQGDFAQFARFLHLFQQGRGQRTEVSGLPVFLVLTKCDLLATPTDSPAAWLELMEARKTQVATLFEAFLTRDAAAGEVPFGRIDLHLWATAVKRPELLASPARPREPFGVAELFRQCLDAAYRYRRRRQRSTRRLVGTVLASLGALAALAAALFGLLLYRAAGPPAELESAVDRLRHQDQATSPASRLRNAPARAAELKRLTEHPAFGQLPEAKQEFIRTRQRELQAYREYERAFLKILPPYTATTEEQLGQVEASLNSLPVPDEFRADWALTETGRLHAEWLEDVAAIRRELQRVFDWYQDLIRRGTQVLAESKERNLPARAQAVLNEAGTPPFPEFDPDRAIPDSPRVTYGTIFGFRKIMDVRAAWQAIKDRLTPAARFQEK